MRNTLSIIEQGFIKEIRTSKSFGGITAQKRMLEDHRKAINQPL